MNAQSVAIDDARRVCRDLLVDAVGDPAVATRMESAVHCSSGSRNVYYANVVKCLVNLRDPAVLTRVTSGEWAPEDFHRIPRELLNPGKWAQIHDACNPKSLKARKKGISKCPRCKSWYTAYTLVQTRSGDEGMTQKFICEDCEFAWKT